MVNKDWLPASREARLAMGETWSQILATKGAAWNVPDSLIDTLNDKIAALQAALATPASNRTPTVNAKIRIAARELTEVERDIKKRYFYEPPLNIADFVSLGLKPRDTVSSHIGRPAGIPVLNVTYDRAGRIVLHIQIVEGEQTNVRANYGIQVYYGIYAPGDTLPASGEDLRERKFTRVKKVLFSFKPADKGKTAVFCAKCENSKGDAGDWGETVSATIA